MEEVGNLILKVLSYVLTIIMKIKNMLFLLLDTLPIELFSKAHGVLHGVLMDMVI